MKRAPGIAELLGHAKKACADAVGSDRGAAYATALSAQASALRITAELLDLEVLKARLGSEARESVFAKEMGDGKAGSA
ncbi:MAG TPA: hypothetical protein VGM17_02425 [Rhizomicrobium sp.]|jgi:hypothetical protein